MQHSDQNNFKPGNIAVIPSPSFSLLVRKEPRKQLATGMFVRIAINKSAEITRFSQPTP